MSRWQSRVDDLLYEGESVRESIDVGTARVVVTSHRVLAFTPEIDGQNFRQVDRPNVDGLSNGALSEADLLERGIRFGIIGGVLIVVGVMFDFESIVGDVNFGDANVDEVGIGGMMSMAQSMMDLLANLDNLLRVFGLLALFLSTVLLGVYWYLRTPTLVIEVAGESEDIHVPRPDELDAIKQRLERAILPDPVGPADSSETPTGEVPADPLRANNDGLRGFLKGVLGSDSPTPAPGSPADQTPTTETTVNSTPETTNTAVNSDEESTADEYRVSGDSDDEEQPFVDETTADAEADGGFATEESEQETSASEGWRDDL